MRGRGGGGEVGKSSRQASNFGRTGRAKNRSEHHRKSYPIVRGRGVCVSFRFVVTCCVRFSTSIECDASLFVLVCLFVC